MIQNEPSLGNPGALSLVVPCYNEENRLNVSTFEKFLSATATTNLIFVNDGSADATLQVLGALRRGAETQVRVLDIQPNGGKAEAVRKGMLHALVTDEPAFVGFWDADLATPLDAIPRFLDVLTQHPGVDMVFGARVKLLGRAVERKEFRHYLGRIFATTVSLMLRMPIYDTQCGAKIFRVTPCLRTILEQPFLSKWVFDVEMLARFVKECEKSPAELSKTIYEYPLEVWRDVEGSKLRPGDFFQAFTDIARIKLRYLW